MVLSWNLFSVRLAVIRRGVPLALPLYRSFQYLGLSLERFIRIEYFLVFEFHSKPSRAQNRAALVLITDTLLFWSYFQRGFSLLSNLSFLSLVLSTEDHINRK